MSRQKKDFLFWVVVLGVLFGQIVLIWILVQNNTRAVEVLGWITGAAIPAIAFLYSLIQKRSLRLFLLINKIAGSTRR